MRSINGIIDHQITFSQVLFNKVTVAIPDHNSTSYLFSHKTLCGAQNHRNSEITKHEIVFELLTEQQILKDQTGNKLENHLILK